MNSGETPRAGRRRDSDLRRKDRGGIVAPAGARVTVPGIMSSSGHWNGKGCRMSDLQVTPLNALHRALGAKMVPFAGYEMPVQYPWA